MGERLVQKAKLILAPPLWRFLVATVRVTRMPERGADAPSVIFACLHRDILPALLYVRPARPVLMVSNSPDGDILIRTLGPGRYGFVRGSTGRTGGPAFVRLLAALKAGHDVGLAVDGPKGPFGEIHEGVIQLSRLAQRPIVPLLIRPQRHRVLGTWDRTVVPFPFSRVHVEEAGTVQVPAAASGPELETWRRQLAEILLEQGGDCAAPPAAPGGPDAKGAELAAGDSG